MSTTTQFEKQSYLNLQTFRKNGAGVKTPVWFVQEDGALFVVTEASSGKVKRIRGNARVQIAPCKGNGDLLGEWVDASARAINDDAVKRKVNRLMNQKYGLMKFMFDLMAKFQRSQRTVIEIKAG